MTSRAATGSMQDGATTRVVAFQQPAGTKGLDATTAPVSSLRSPLRMRIVGTVAVCDRARSVRVAW